MAEDTFTTVAIVSRSRCAVIWYAAQSLIAHAVMATNVPAAVAASLHELLQGNITKVAISASLWLPYLLLSKRVNVTFRHRVPR